MTHATLGQAHSPHVGLGRVRTQRVRLFTEADPLVLDSGERLAPVEVAFETYGRLDESASNAVVVCHALTGDAHAAGHHGRSRERGWWDTMIGPGKPVDSDRLFVVCANLLGGCRGTTGPSSIEPDTGRPYGLRFPQLSVRDLVTVQRRLLAHLGVERPYAAIGGSLGAMQVLQWAVDYPRELEHAVLVGASARLSAENIAFSKVAREAILRDEHFQGGDYYGTGRAPAVGLSLARMLAHITYLSPQGLERKFGRSRRARGGAPGPAATFAADFEVESYLEHQGRKFVERFDANSYLYLSRAMDYFDPFADEDLAITALAAGDTRFLVTSFDSDWRFSSDHAREIVRVLEGSGCAVRHEELHSPWGHDSFLLPLPEYLELVAGFLD